jgi:UDP-hydrolysing UDP-N-acetyl-D-glucosamine 2-epimerase
VVVLGDRIEAFAAASAASIAGIAVCHIHGGDRAEGIADEAMRHAITKLAHLHCAATTLSAERIRQMGERADLVHVTGSPAIDGLRAIRPMGDRDAAKLGDPKVIVLMHPAGLSIEEEWEWPITVATVALSVTGSHFRMRSKGLPRTLVLAPNSDPGSEITARCLNGTLRGQDGVEFRDHLPRSEFLALLQRLRNGRGVLLGNSSAALIEAAALRVAAVNFGPRQSGRERGANIVDVTWPDLSDFDAIERLLRHAISGRHPYGDGRAGPRIAALLAKVDPHDSALLRKRNVY